MSFSLFRLCLNSIGVLSAVWMLLDIYLGSGGMFLTLSIVNVVIFLSFSADLIFKNLQYSRLTKISSNMFITAWIVSSILAMISGYGI